MGRQKRFMKRVKIQYLRQIEIEDLKLAVWLDKDSEFDVDWRGAIIVVKNSNVTDEEIKKFIDKPMIKYFKSKMEQGYVSFTEKSFNSYVRKCFNYYYSIMKPRNGLIVKIINSAHQGSFYMNFVYVSRYINVARPTDEICWVIVHELTHFRKGYKDHVHDFEDRVSEVLREHGTVPY